jgi:hypothetical protein
LLGVLAAACLYAAGASAFASTGAGAGEVNEPRGIAIEQESGDVYVSDRDNRRIDKFTSAGEFVVAWGWGVADGKSEELQTCTTTCFSGLIGGGSGEFHGNEGIAVDNDPLSPSHGDVYVLEAENHRVQKFGPNGEFMLMFGGEVNAGTSGNVCVSGEECQAGVAGGGPGAFEDLFRRAITVDSAGTVYVGDLNRVQLFNEFGAVESETALPGAGFSENLAVDSAKDIYLKSSELAGVRKYEANGTELPPPRDEAGSGEREAIAIDPSDDLFVNDFREEVHHIFAFSPAGEQFSSFDRGTHAEDGELGIAYGGSAEALYVLTQSGVRIVTLPPPGPLVLTQTEKVGELEPTSAKLEALVNPEGPEETNCHFEYGTTTAYGQSTPETLLEGGEHAFDDQPIAAELEGLSPGTTYHFRVVCENAAKEATTGADQAFTTLPPVSVDATSASQVNATSARLEAELNPHGVASEYRFEYGTTTAYGQSIPVPDGSVAASKVDVEVEDLIQELIPSTTYHYRVVAHNGLGSIAGADHSFTTQGPASILADGRTWEMVSPPNKHGSPLEPLTEEGGLIQTGPNGGVFAYVALGPIDTDPKGVRAPHDTQLLATRSSSGWSTQDIATPHEEISIIRPGFPSEYKFFAADLSASVVQPEGVTPLSPKATERTPYRREANGEFVPLVTTENVPPGTKFGGNELEPGNGEWGNGVEFRIATPDLSHAVLVSPQILAPGFEAGFEANGAPNLYELSDGKLTLISVLPSGQAATEAGASAGVGHNNLDMRGAISRDGSRIVFETNNGEHLYTRDVALGQTVQLDEVQPGATGGAGAVEFEAASTDGSKVFFLDGSRLTRDATAQPSRPDLYMCEIGTSEGHLSCALSDLSVDENVGEAANVLGEVSAIDPSGTHVYFAANGVLTSTPNAHGEVAVPGSCNTLPEIESQPACGNGEEKTANLYEYNTATHEISLVAVLASGDDPDWAGRTNLGGLGSLTGRSSPNGRYFTFMSQRSLTGFDNRDVLSGQRDEEVFQFNSETGALSCVSCNPTGARPIGVFDKEAFPGLLVDHARTWFGRWLASSIPGWTLGPSHVVSLYQSRYLSDSGREFFNSSDQLVPQDTNNVNDVYEFEPPGVGDCTSSSSTYSPRSSGCISLISGGSSKEESAFLDASESGDEAFFLTSARLLKTDVDAAFDIYDAHVCSPSSPCPPPPAPPAPGCEGDSCQNPSSPPGETTPSSLTYKGPQNPPPLAPATPAKAKPPTKAQLLTKALKACKKKKAKAKRLSCERQARKKYGAKKASAKKKGKKASHAQKRRGHR